MLCLYKKDEEAIFLPKESLSKITVNKLNSGRAKVRVEFCERYDTYDIFLDNWYSDLLDIITKFVYNEIDSNSKYTYVEFENLIKDFGKPRE